MVHPGAYRGNKRQKELKRLEKQKEKREKRLQKKSQEPAEPGSEFLYPEPIPVEDGNPAPPSEDQEP